jgi:peptidase E
MPAPVRQIFAYSGILRSGPDQPKSPALAEYAISLAPAAGRKRVCYVPTAAGDSPGTVDGAIAAFGGRSDIEFSVLRLFPQPSVPDIGEHLLAQDVILVGGGSVVNLMAVWRAHGLPPILRQCWDAGVVLAGSSAGSLCWHVGGPTDSYGDSLDPFTDGLGFVSYSNGVHDDLDDQPRRPVFRQLVAAGTLPAGYATEDGVGLHYVGTQLHEAVAALAGVRAWRVQPGPDGGYREDAIEPRPI